MKWQFETHMTYTVCKMFKVSRPAKSGKYRRLVCLINLFIIKRWLSKQCIRMHFMLVYHWKSVNMLTTRLKHLKNRTRTNFLIKVNWIKSVTVKRALYWRLLAFNFSPQQHRTFYPSLFLEITYFEAHEFYMHCSVTL
jgi:hypothetical protein